MADFFTTNMAIFSEAEVEGKAADPHRLGFRRQPFHPPTELPMLFVWNELTENQIFFQDSAGIKDIYIAGGKITADETPEANLTLYGEVIWIGGVNCLFHNPEKTSSCVRMEHNSGGLCGGALAVAMDASLILTMTRYEASTTAYVLDQNIQSGAVLGSAGLISGDSVRRFFTIDRNIWRKCEV